MAKAADTGSKRLISLAPDAWLRWVTGNADVISHGLVAPAFQWVSRETDALLRAYCPHDGEFLTLNELQLYYDRWMPLRTCAYIVLAEEKYRLPVYAVLINILPPPAGVSIADRYERMFKGLQVRCDYRVINLWEVDADLVFEQPLPSLLPFVPVLRGGGEETMVRRAVQELRKDETLNELEPLLAFFARFVLESKVIQQIMRWDMVVLEKSPWYQEILQRGREEGREEGWEKGREEGREEGWEKGREEERRYLIRRILERRFGLLPPALSEQFASLSPVQLEAWLDRALQASSLEAFEEQLTRSDNKPTDSGNGTTEQANGDETAS